MGPEAFILIFYKEVFAMVGEMKGQKFQPSVSKIGGIDAKYAILIAYFGAVVLGFISGAQYVAWLVPLIVYFVDKENKFIAFHAMQAFLLEIVASIVYIIFGIIVFATAAGVTAAAMSGNIYGLGAGAGAIIATTAIAAIIGIVVLIFAIIAAVKGYGYEIYEIPLVGKQAEKIVFKTTG